MPKDRRLAAIMFTDIVGYTALMGKDEDKAFKVLRKNREIQRPLIKKYHGEWLKEMGDGILATFTTASDAVRCAGEIQNNAKKAGIPLRIGIHEGEVEFEGGDVLGDGVNVASRLEELAEEGCINISGAVYKDIKNKSGILVEFVEEKVLKNVDEPVKVYKVDCEVKEEPQAAISEKISNRRAYFIIGSIFIAIVVVVLIWFPYPRKQAVIEDEVLDKSIAVLPFVNLSDDPGQEYFSDGMMDEILMHLYKIGDLQVISRTSVMGYKGTTKKMKEIADELDAAHILEGSVRKSGNKVRIIVQLIDPETDQHIWAESYDVELADVFQVQNEVAQQIAKALKAVISPEVKERIEKDPTDNLVAYDYYLKGNEAYWHSWDAMDNEFVYESIKYYEKAIELDENFSLAYTGIGRSYWWLAMFASNINRVELYDKSKMKLAKAIDLDPYNGWAYAELSVVTISWDWDSTATKKHLEMAIKLMPSDPNAYIHYFYFEYRLGNCDRMDSLRSLCKQFWKGIDHPFTDWSLSINFCQKKYSEIARIADKYWDGDISIQQAWRIFFSYLILGELENAQKVVNYSKENFEQKSASYIFNGLLKAKQDNNEGALAMCDSLMQENTYYGIIALINAVMGNTNKMYEFLNKAITERESLHQNINLFPEFIPCENDPEFQQIKREIWIPRENSI